VSDGEQDEVQRNRLNVTHLLHVFLKRSSLIQHSLIFLLTLFLGLMINEKAFIYDVHQGLLSASWMG